MKLKNKIYLVQFLVVVLTLSFLYIYYNSTITKHKEYLNDNISKTININTHILKTKLLELSDKFKNREDKFKELHKKALKIYKENSSKPLEEIKEKVLKKCSLTDIDIDLFIIDKNYTIADATFKKDIGFNLGIIKEAKIYLDKAKKDDDIHLASNVVIDAIDSHIKKYSYSKLDENSFFEVGFKDKYLKTYLKDSIEQISNITNSTLQLYAVNIEKDLNSEYYKEVTLNTYMTKKEFFEKTQKFSIDKNTDNPIVNSHRTQKPIKYIKNDIYDIFVPIKFKDDEISVFKSSLVLNIKVDVSEYSKELENIKQNFYMFAVVLISLMVLLYYFIRNHFYKPMIRLTHIVENENKVTDDNLLTKTDEFGILVEKYNKLYDSLNNEIEKNQLLLNENKQFISDMVHQIRTPLSVIMGNTSFIKRKTDTDVDKYITQINSSINMLTNSYEDLSYIISNDTMEYPIVDLNLSQFLEDRISFFTVISQANRKKLVSNIQKDVSLQINDTELERIIDNNISNAIKYSNKDTTIEISLQQHKNSNIILKFLSNGKPITNTTKIFEKNYTESNVSKRSLGLGLFMVKNICDKYDIEYSVSSKDGVNIFQYIFKN